MVGSENNPDQQPAPPSAHDDATMFDLAPVSLWLEDYSAVKTLFETWRHEGIIALREHLEGHPERIKACSQRIRIIKVNRKTLRLFEARDVSELVDNLDAVFRDDMLATHIRELEQLWDGALEFSSRTVNYTLTGTRLDIQLSGSVLAGHEDSWDRVLVAIEDVTERETALRRAASSEIYANGLFDHSPVSLWVEDFSTIKHLIDEARTLGISNFRTFTDVHPEFVQRCMREIRVLNVNRHTLRLFGAPDLATLLKRIRDVFRDNMTEHFREQLIDLWDGKLFQQREVVNYALDGSELHLHLQFSVLPGHEDDWSLVQVALTDITARKKAEAYLEFLGKHDPLTKLYNRSFYNDELNRLERKGPRPVTVIVGDLNGLKAANDQLGHAAGDDLLRRIGEVLAEAVEPPHTIARIGGDEFAILMPASDEHEGESLMAHIAALIEANNQFYPGLPLSLSVGAATAKAGERLEATVGRADALMYEAKRLYYSEPVVDRRTSSRAPM
jgi:diguanylate cyclase (GGDEF)-like protein